MMRPYSLITIVSIVLSLVITGIRSFELAQCTAPLGMESGSIADEDITASSTFDHKNVGPQHGRVRTEINAGAWCPQEPATPELREWLEIDLHRVHVITATETQGRFGNGHGIEYAENYMLEYWRPRLNKWIRYRSRDGKEILDGNINTYLESKSVLDPPIWASKVRFLPFSYHQRTVCMRVELYGCPWSAGLVAYSMPQGDKKTPNWELFDNSYDGHWDGERLRSGMGQLTDGILAPDDFRHLFYSLVSRPGTQGWVGWRNDSRPGGRQYVEIIFEFDAVREFTALHLYANNQFSNQVQVFSKLLCWFSASGHKYHGQPISYDYVPDRIWETPRNVSVKLHHRRGRFVKLQLWFAARWILLSEVSFESTLVSENETLSEFEHLENNELNSGEHHHNQHLAVADASDQQHRTPTLSAAPGAAAAATQYLGVVVGVLSVLVAIMVAVVLFVIVQQRRYKASSSRPGSQIPDKTALYREPTLCSSEYADVRGDPEYAIPLQSAKNSTVSPYAASHTERFYAATEICKGGGAPGFVPPPPPLSTPPPVRLGRQPRYIPCSSAASTTCKPYVGP